MTTKNTALRRLATGAGALALSMVGLLGLGTAASAAGFEPPNEEATTSLTLHKHVYAGETAPPTGAPLAGVEFTVQEIGVGTPADCVAIDLGTPEGWQQVKAAIDGFVPATATLPAGFCNLGTALTGTTLADGTATFPGVWGLYLVKETDPGPNLISTPAAPFLVTVPYPTALDVWDYSVDAYPKNVLTTVEPTKTVAENNTGTALVPGATVPWTVTVPVPEAAFPYNTISVKDVPETGMTFAAFGTVTLNGTPLTAGTQTPETGDYYVSGDTLTLTTAGLAKVNALAADGLSATTATLVVNLTTTVNAGINPDTYTNKANVTLNGQTTPTDEPKTYWGKLVVNKHVEGASTPLAGATFVVYPANTGGTCDPFTSGMEIATGTTDALGVWEQVLWIANAQSTDTSAKTKVYCLVETVAPNGYILDSTARVITLSTLNASFTTSYNFPNTPPEGPELPMTGAGGTMALSLAGLALVGLGSGGIFLSRRRRAQA